MSSNLTYAAIDFETATSDRHSACAVAIINIENGVLVDEYYTLIRPPKNRYQWQTIRVHGIEPEETEHAQSFEEVWPEIKKRLEHRKIVAHNQAFDRSVLRQCVDYYNIENQTVEMDKSWECTVQIFRKIGFRRTKLNLMCQRFDIELDHHNALSDALACARLYYISKNRVIDPQEFD